MASAVSGDNAPGTVHATAVPAAEAVQAIAPRRIRLPPYRLRRYTTARVGQLRLENESLDLPFKDGFSKSLFELEAEAERQSLIYAGRSRLYASLYYILGLPAAILAAIAGATALASATGRFVAGIIALASSALSAAVVYLDSGKQRDRAAKTRTYWDDLYTQIHIARLTKMIDYTVTSGPEALNDFYMRSSNIRAGRDPEESLAKRASMPAVGGAGPRWLFPEEHYRYRPEERA